MFVKTADCASSGRSVGIGVGIGVGMGVGMDIGIGAGIGAGMGIGTSRYGFLLVPWSWRQLLWGGSWIQALPTKQMGK